MPRHRANERTPATNGPHFLVLGRLPDVVGREVSAADEAEVVQIVVIGDVMPEQRIEETCSVVVENVYGRHVVTRKRPGEEDDQLGTIEAQSNGTYKVIVQFRGTWVDEFEANDFDYAVSNLSKRTTDQRERAWYYERDLQKASPPRRDGPRQASEPPLVQRRRKSYRHQL